MPKYNSQEAARFDRELRGQETEADIQAGRIPDIGKAHTAARAEKVIREYLTPEVAEELRQQLPKDVEPSFAAVGHKRGEERIADYDPKKEAKLDQIRQAAEGGIAKIDAYLASHQPTENENGLYNTKRFFEILAQARKYLQRQITQIDLGATWQHGDSKMYHPKNTIPHTINQIDGIISHIEQTEQFANRKK